MLIWHTSMIFLEALSPKMHSAIPILGCLISLMVQLLSLILPVELIQIQKYRMITDRQHFHMLFLMHHWTCGRLPIRFLQKFAHIMGLALLIILSDLSAILQFHHLDDVVIIHPNLIYSAKPSDVISSLEEWKVKWIQGDQIWWIASWEMNILHVNHYLGWMNHI